MALDRLPDSEVIRALRELPSDFRTAAYLADVEGFSCAACCGIRPPSGASSPTRATALDSNHLGGEQELSRPGAPQGGGLGPLRRAFPKIKAQPTFSGPA